MAGKQLSHAEVWDDTILQDSWNEALAEYKKYHSLAVKGERVKLGPLPTQTESLPTNGDAVPGSEAKAEAEVPTSNVEMPSTSEQVTGPALPLSMLGNVQNGDMKNLMVSWYYAGYYTGLYEGKQQGYAMATQRQTE